jgi:hypothetical protein
MLELLVDWLGAWLVCCGWVVLQDKVQVKAGHTKVTYDTYPTKASHNIIRAMNPTGHLSLEIEVSELHPHCACLRSR